MSDRRRGDGSPGKEREAVDEEPEQEDQASAADDLPPDGRFVVASGPPRLQREVRRDAGDEQEERKDEVCRRPAVPAGVLERGIDRGPGARVVDQEHSCDGQPAKDVQRQQPLTARLRGGLHRRARRPSLLGGRALDVDVGRRSVDRRAHMNRPVIGQE